MANGNNIGQIVSALQNKAITYAHDSHVAKINNGKIVPKSFWIAIAAAYFFALFIGSGLIYEAGKEGVSAVAYVLLALVGIGSYVLPTLAILVMLFFIAPARVKHKELVALEAAAAEREYWNTYNFFYAQTNRHEILTVLKSDKSPFKKLIEKHKIDWFSANGMRSGYNKISELTYENRDYCYDIDKLLASYYEAEPIDKFGNQIVKFYTPSKHADSDFDVLLEIFTAELKLIRTEQLDEDPNNGSVLMMFIRVNPLEANLNREDTPVLHLTEEERDNPYLWLPIGVNQRGMPFTIPLFLPTMSVRGMHAGQSGTGKSGIFWQQLLFAILNKNIDVFVMCGKGGSELGWTKPYVKTYASTAQGFIDMLDVLDSEVERRTRILEENRNKGTKRYASAWNHIDDGPFLYWAWDEIVKTKADIKRLDPKFAKDIDERIAAITTTGRSLGIGFNFSSQSFRASVLPIEISKTSFNYGVGYQMKDPFESSYVGFDSNDFATPDKIKGKLMSSGPLNGMFSSIGQFATTGINAGYGKSYYLTHEDLIRELGSRHEQGIIGKNFGTILDPPALQKP